MGYGQVYNLGAFKDCAEGGLAQSTNQAQPVHYFSDRARAAA